MGRLTQFLHYINQEELDKEEDPLYTHLKLTTDIEELRLNNLAAKKAAKKGLKVKEDGTFSLF